MRIEKTILEELDAVIDNRKNSNGTVSYTASLFEGGINKISEKILEEAKELIEAASGNKKRKDQIIHEAADLLFHILVLLNFEDIKSHQMLLELKSRMGISGLEEKKNR
ncbi:MAG: phosphoribosyl-ATP diphosphatase [SAR86 cluster bacterium]|jgi:phosphoribosyl-ATP pyrophosphohydrolase|nr:phosphoribosyl-ATP diphosphatase [SAR86 cluster bacterium]